LSKIISSCNECIYLSKFPTNDLQTYEDAYCRAVNKHICNVYGLCKEGFKFPDFCPLDSTDEEQHFICKGCSNCDNNKIIKKENIKKIDIYCKCLDKIVYENINIESFCYKSLSCPYL
jgi:hypothetical protein